MTGGEGVLYVQMMAHCLTVVVGGARPGWGGRRAGKIG